MLATEWGPHGIRVAGIVPGPIEGTEGFARLGDLDNLNNKDKANSAFEGKGYENETLKLAKSYMPVQRFGHVQDISNAALFLGSPAASFITGTNLTVDGGQYLTIPNTMFGFGAFVKNWSRAKL